MSGQSLCFPKKVPTKYAPESPNHAQNRTYSTIKIPSPSPCAEYLSKVILHRATGRSPPAAPHASTCSKRTSLWNFSIISAITITYSIAAGTARNLIWLMEIIIGKTAPKTIDVHLSTVNLSHFIARVSSHTPTADKNEMAAQ